jgi:uncharacterized protein
VLFIHPFAEEMNKSRRMAALQARALAQRGNSVLQIDLSGCGDSDGDFGEATWSAWKEDIFLGYEWLRQQTSAPMTLWGLRTGCLLAVDAGIEIREQLNFIFWQPVLSGKQYWQQFMRLKAAGELASGQGKVVLEQLRQQIAAGEAIEVAGYTLAPELIRDIENAELLPPIERKAAVAWFELSLRPDASLSPAAQRHLEHWRAVGYQVAAQVIDGPSFWQTTEVVDAPRLIEATCSAVENWK